MSDAGNNNTKWNAGLSRISLFLSVLAGVMVLVMLAIFAATDNAEVTQTRTAAGYIRIENAACRDIADDGAPIGIRKEYTFTLDKILANDMYLAFYTVHQYVVVRLDGETIFSLQPSASNRLSRTVGSNWVMIPVYREDTGKEVQVEITPVYENFRDRKVEFLLGSDLAIYKDRLSKDLPQLVLGIMAVFVGMVFVCVAGYNIYKKNRGKGLAALGIFCAMIGIWKLTDTRFTPFILPGKPVLLFYISVTMLMLGMIPLMKWTEGYYTESSRRIFDSYCIVAAVVCMIQLLLQFSGMVDLRENLFVTHTIIAAGVTVIIGLAIYERAKYPDKPKMPVGSKLPYICVVGVIIDVAAYYVKGNSSGLLFSLLAFLLYIVFMGIATMFNYSEQERQLAEKDRQLAEQDRQLAEQARKLTERRIAAMMSQIRSHFIFNVLTTISTYCKSDPGKADDALIRFARYLRRNIRIIEQEGLVGFQEELEQLEDYVALEKLRFGNMITFVKEIEVTDFRLPPLTIQPIVENAIKHGLVEHDRSGKIILQTVRESGYIRIMVTDDGIGFVPEKCAGTDAVGIKNVRYRLENMINGSLTIESAPGKGTVVTIKIPIQEAEE